MALVPSNNEPGVPTQQTTNIISVRFVSLSPLQVQINQLQIKKPDPMKSSTPAQYKPVISSPFQIAARLDDCFHHAHAAGWKKPAPAARNPAFTTSTLHSEKPKMASKSAKTENDTFAAPLTNGHAPARLATHRATPIRREDNSVDKQSGFLPGKLKKIEFSLEAPSAKSVKLAADFTGWEKYPLNMMRSENGVWFSVIWLAPGQYSYRFVVDGQWCDDPRSTRRVPNPFGTENAVIAVT